MNPELVYPEQIDRRLSWPVGTARRLARRRRLPHYVLPDGEVRLVWADIEPLVMFVPAEGPATAASGGGL